VKLSTVSRYAAILLTTYEGYGPQFFKNLGFAPAKQLLYNAALLTLTLGLSVLIMPFVDRVPRNKLIGIGMFGAAICLACEAAIVAEFVPSTNENALKTGVAMFFVYQVFDTWCLNGAPISRS
jgi:MFS family permease